MKESVVHPHVESERAHLFTSHSAGEMEDEYLDLLYGLVRVWKPSYMLETGTYHGQTAERICDAMEANGMGTLVSVENNIECHKIALTALPRFANPMRVNMVFVSSLDYLKQTDRVFDAALFDSNLEIRMDEFILAVERGNLKSGTPVAFHDSSHARIEHAGATEDWRSIKFWGMVDEHRHLFSELYNFNLSRGLLIGRVA